MNELVLDVSMWDEGIDLSAWKKKRNVWGVIIKAGGNEGGRYKDPLFEDHYRSAKSLGLHVGAYYYTTSTTKSDAKADADHFAGLLKGKSLDMPAYMDVEDARQYALGKRALTDVIKAFCDQVSKSGLKSGIYVNGSTLTNLVYPDELSKYAVWVAAWKQGWPSYALDAGLWQQGTMRLSDGYVFFDDVSGCVDASWCSVDYPSQATDKETVEKKADKTVDVKLFATSKKLTLKGQHVRSKPSTKTGEIVADYHNGDTVIIDGLVINDGYVWGTYIGGSGNRRYIALGSTEFVYTN